MTTLDKYLDLKVRELVSPVVRKISAEEQERHRIYCLLLLSMVAYQFCATKAGDIADRARPERKDPNDPHAPEPKKNALLPPSHWASTRGRFLENDYLGHNIAAFAVDRDGFIIDFDFNHNEVFNSSVEHAEARLLNRLFKLTNIHDSWDVGDQQEGDLNKPPVKYGNVLEGVTIYTSLESCAQCSGIMTLGNVKDVIYLQEDPGQYKIGNIMYNLTAPSDSKRKHQAPLPISADQLGFPYFEKLNRAYEEYVETQKDYGLTSFLCTAPAYRIFLEAEEELSRFSVIHRDWRMPSSAGDSKLTNEGVLKECLSFYRYVVRNGRRGTPH